MSRIIHRIVVLLAGLLAGWLWLLAQQSLGAPDGSSGFSVFSAVAHPAAAMLLLAVLAVPAAVLGLAMAATGHPLAGPFVPATGLVVFAAALGPIDGYLRRVALPEGFGRLAFEVLLLAVGWAVFLLLLQRTRPAIRQRAPKVLHVPHVGNGTWGPINRPALAGALLTALVGGVLANVFIQSSDTWQVIGSLILGFAVAGMAGQMVFNPGNPILMLLSPAAVALVAYGWGMISFDTSEAVFAAWYAERLPGAALALPIHYASAGVIGVILGVAWAQSIVAGKKQAEASA